jgi:hypothetical protein
MVIRMVAIAAAVLAAACGDGREDEPSPFAGQFDDPADFPRDGCEDGGAAGIAPEGIWHTLIQLDFPERWFPAVFRVAAGAERGTINGRPASVSWTGGDLIVRAEWTGADGAPRLLAFDACARTPDGGVAGAVARCAGAACETGEFIGQKIVRRPGEAEADGLALVSEWAGPPGSPWPAGSKTLDVQVRDGRAYVVRQCDLRIVDVGTPARPRDLGAAVVPDCGVEYWNDIQVVTAQDRTYALVASSARGVIVLDVSDPQAPTEVATFPQTIGTSGVVPHEANDHQVNVHTVYVDGTLAYAANLSTGGIDIHDVADPRNPLRRGEYVHASVATDPRSFVHDLYVVDGRAYLDHWSQGLVVVDVADPARSAAVGQYADYGWRTNHSNWVTTAGGRLISVMGDEMYYAHVRIVDVDPASPEYMTEIGSFETRPEVSVHNIVAIGELAYVTHYQDGLRLLDLRDPTRPQQIAYYNTWRAATAPGESFYEGAIAVDVSADGRLIYVADTERGLLVLRPAP